MVLLGKIKVVQNERRMFVDRYVCDPCGYVYDPAVGDPDSGIAPGTPWEEVPADWVCPVCGLDKDSFVEL